MAKQQGSGSPSYLTPDEMKELIKSRNKNLPLSEKLEEKINLQVSSPTLKNFTPKDIKQYLDGYVISQERAKKDIAVAVAYHYKHIDCLVNNPGTPIKKNNVLMIGPTGVGKTYMLEKISQLIDVPLLVVDCSKLTKSGYIGNSVNDMLIDLFAKTNGDIETAEKSIIYLDEIDKIRTQNSYGQRDIAGQDVQVELLKIIEGAEVPIEVGKKKIMFNTKGVLFIAGGAFPELENIIKKRKNIKKEIGFGKEQTVSKTGELFREITTEDLVNYGLLPEFIGRLPVITALSELKQEDLENILKNSQESILKHYEAELAGYSIKIKFTDEAIREIAKMAYGKGIGARGLTTICENFLMELKYELPSTNIKNVVVTEELFRNPQKYLEDLNQKND
ncbi:AAA family ATPase [Candidatus Woesearchaeota archaeon]|nr:AAA family ATPase [Candidatus Woesearchaeota archaeon]